MLSRRTGHGFVKDDVRWSTCSGEGCGPARRADEFTWASP